MSVSGSGGGSSAPSGSGGSTASSGGGSAPSGSSGSGGPSGGGGSVTISGGTSTPPPTSSAPGTSNPHVGTTLWTTSCGDGTIFITSGITTLTGHLTIITSLGSGTLRTTYYTSDQIDTTVVTTTGPGGTPTLTTVVLLTSGEFSGSTYTDGSTIIQQSSFGSASSALP